MAQIRKYFMRTRRYSMVQIVVWCAMHSIPIYAQSTANTSTSGAKTYDLPQIMERLKVGEATGVDVEKLGNIKAIQTTPLLEQQFASSKDADMSSKIASTLEPVLNFAPE